MECPNIDNTIPESEINKPINYKEFGGSDYIFYDHTDPDGVISRVQFCKRIGRKKDVFECLNESEWKNCSVYDGEQ